MKRKNILITGASSGLGKGLALEFAKQGANLALCARRMEHLQALKQEINNQYPETKIFVRTLDVTNTQEVFDVFNAFNEDFKAAGESLDRIIVNAGLGKGGPIGKGFETANMQTAQTNFCGALSQFEAALAIFRAQNHGHLVAMSSMSAFRGLPGAVTTYAASKAALKSLAEGVRVELLHKPIVVSSVFPGYIQSEMTDGLPKPPPFMISLDKGARLLAQAINKEKANTYVPAWPWALVRRLLPLMTTGMLRKM